MLPILPNLSFKHTHTHTHTFHNSLGQSISGYQGNLWMMSCGSAVVPGLTSEGRELLILSREWPKMFGPSNQTCCYSLPSPPTPIDKYRKKAQNKTKKNPTTYLRPRSYRMRMRLAEITAARQELLCLHRSSSATSIPMSSPADYLWVRPSDPCVPPVFFQTHHRLLFHWMLLRTKGQALNYLCFCWQIYVETTMSREIKKTLSNEL